MPWHWVTLLLPSLIFWWKRKAGSERVLTVWLHRVGLATSTLLPPMWPSRVLFSVSPYVGWVCIVCSALRRFPPGIRFSPLLYDLIWFLDLVQFDLYWIVFLYRHIGSSLSRNSPNQLQTVKKVFKTAWLIQWGETTGNRDYWERK